MTCTLYRVPASETRRLRANPAAVETLRFPPGSTPPVVEVREKGITGWLLHLVGVKITQVDPSWVPPENPPAHDGSEADLDKAWHGLHFIFTGTAWEGDPPGCFLVRGGEEIGNEDDDSRPRLLDPQEVRQFAALLTSLTDEEFTRRFDPDRMTALEIYPEKIWNRGATSEHPPIDYLREAFRELRKFVATTADRGDAIVIDVS